MLGSPGRAKGHRRASSSWQEVTPRAFIRPPSSPRSPWVSNYVRIASFVSFLMALIPLPLHWTSEGWKCSSNSCHRLLGKSVLISLPITGQRKRRQKLWLSVNTPVSFHLDFSIVQGVYIVIVVYMVTWIYLADLKQVWLRFLPRLNAGGDSHSG